MCFSWRRGVTPGQRGSAVLAGHTYSRGAGVFDRLGQLHRGNLVKIVRGGKTVTFKVTKVQRHVRHASNSQVASWSDPVGPSRVVLVTCGDYLGDGHYGSRIVVSAKRV